MRVNPEVMLSFFIGDGRVRKPSIQESLPGKYLEWRAAKISGNMKAAKPTRHEVIQWVLQIWDAIPGVKTIIEFICISFNSKGDLLQKGMSKLIIKPAMSAQGCFGVSKREKAFYPSILGAMN